MTRPASPLSPTSLAIAGRRTFGGNLATGIFRRIFMPMLAMRPSLLPNGIGKSADSQAAKIGLFVLGKDFSGLPAQCKATINSIVMKSRFFGPLHDGFSHAFVGYPNIAISVIRLLLSRSPAAIIRLIAFRIINAFQGKPLGTPPHVFFKSNKIIPARTYFDAAPAISVIMRRIGVITSGSHLQPYAIYWGTRFSVFKPHSGYSLMEDPSILQRKRKVK